jgi:tetratricopeptide (TPR) repeat protein
MVESAPDSVHGLTGHAKMLIGQGDYVGARPFVGKAMEIYSDYSDLQGVYGILAFYDGRFDEAARMAALRLRNNPKFTDYLLGALVLAKQGRVDESKILIDEFLSGHIDDPIVRFLLAVHWHVKGDAEKLQEYMDAVPGRTPEEKVAYLQAFLRTQAPPSTEWVLWQ